MATKEKDDWLQRVLGVPQPTGNAPTTPDPARRKELTARLLSVRDDAKLHGVLADIAGALREAGTAVQGGGLEAEQKVDALESRLAELVRAQRVQQAQQTIGESAPPGGSVVDFAKARLRLDAARAAFDEAVEDLKAAWMALLASDDFVDDPRSTEPATLAAIASLGETVPSFGELGQRIEDALDRMANAGEASQREAEAKEALRGIGELKGRIRADAMLNAMEHTDAGSYAIAGKMTEALDDVASALQG